MGVAARRESTRTAPAPPRPGALVETLSGVGPKRAAQLDALGIRTCADLLNHIPFRYSDRGPVCTISTLQVGRPATLRGFLQRVSRRFGRRPIVRSALEDDAGGRLDLVWFNASYLADRLSRGCAVEISGTPRHVDGRWQMVNPQCHLRDAEAVDTVHARWDSVYAAGGGITSAFIARLIVRELPRLIDSVVEFIPPGCLERHGFIGRAEAYRFVHRPASPEAGESARRRLAFEECLLMQLAVGLRRNAAARMATAAPMPLTHAIASRIERRLPFVLTDAQQRAFREIAADMAECRPMSRLLMGDVGCGKTIVAVCAALLAVAHGHQVAMLAPTTILARQHHARIAELLRGSRVRVELVTGGGPAAARRKTLDALACGTVDVAVGTHALLGDGVRFARLGLAVVDEQHRFGVWQRAALLGKGVTPHALVMSATPIPRTLLMAAFGDLDASIIDERPPGRRAVETERVGPADLPSVWERVAAALAEGQQAYVVHPVIEDDDSSSLLAATTEAKRLQRDVFPDERVSLLHGQMSADAQREVMSRFVAGESRLLVCTTVIEVGVDVPAATLMVVQHADRFGLAQLHQLRGRVGRGAHAGRCILVSDTDSETALRRLDVLCRSDDGFEIAEEDLRLRGPGEQLGIRQHGLPVYRVFRPVDDDAILTAARDEAARILAEDPALTAPAHAALRAALISAHRDRLHLSGIG